MQHVERQIHDELHLWHRKEVAPPLRDEVVDDVPGEVLFDVEDVVRNPEGRGDALCVHDPVEATTGLPVGGNIRVAEGLHRYTDDLMSLVHV